MHTADCAEQIFIGRRKDCTAASNENAADKEKKSYLLYEMEIFSNTTIDIEELRRL